MINAVESVVNASFSARISLSVQVQDRVISEGIQSFSIPANAFEHSNPGEQLNVRATLSDGSPLPDGMIQFDPSSGLFTINADVAREAGIESLDIRITATDSQGNEASTVFRVLFTEEEEVVEEVVEVDENGEVQQDDEDEVQVVAPEENAEEAVEENDDETSDSDSQARVESDSPAGKPTLNEQVQLAASLGFKQESNQLIDDIKKAFNAAA